MQTHYTHFWENPEAPINETPIIACGANGNEVCAATKWIGVDCPDCIAVLTAERGHDA